MSYTQADLDRLNRAITSGRLTVRDSDGRSTTYRSLAELLRARDEVRTELDAAAGRDSSLASRRTVGVMRRTPQADLEG